MWLHSNSQRLTEAGRFVKKKKKERIMCSLACSPLPLALSVSHTLCKDNTRPILQKVVELDSDLFAAAEIKQ